MGPFFTTVLLAALGGSPAPGGEAVQSVAGRPRPGMTTAEVVRLLGPPRKVARQVVYRRCLEQWVYEEPHFLRIEFDTSQGRQSQVLTVHPIPPHRP